MNENPEEQTAPTSTPPSGGRIKKNLMTWLKLAVSLLFIAIVIHSLDPKELAARVRNLDHVYLMASIMLSLTMVAVSAWKWWYLMRLQGFAIPLARMYRWYFIGYFYSNFVPSNMGGDVVRAWLAGRQVKATETALVSVFAERFTGMIFLLSMAVILPFGLANLWREPAVILGIVVALGGLIGIALAWVVGRAGLRSEPARRGMEKIRHWVRADRPGRPARLWEKVSAVLSRFGVRAVELWGILRRRPAALWAVFGLTALHYALAVGNVVLAYRTFGVWPEAWSVACILPVSLMVAMIPITLGNLGIAEGSYVYFFGLLGMSSELTLAMGLLLRLKIIMLGAIGMLAQAGERLEGVPASTGSSES